MVPIGREHKETIGQWRAEVDDRTPTALLTDTRKAGIGMLANGKLCKTTLRDVPTFSAVIGAGELDQIESTADEAVYPRLSSECAQHVPAHVKRSAKVLYHSIAWRPNLGRKNCMLSTSIT